MFLPLSDAPNPKGIPWVNYSLIAACVGVYLFINLPLSFVRPQLDDPALREYLLVVSERLPRDVPIEAVLRQTTQYDLFSFEHGFRPAAPSLGDLFTSMFLHGGLMHLFGNMLFLWIYGDNVEYRLGRLGYVFAYLGTGVAATLFFSLFQPHSQTPLVGASGAISGVLGFYFLWFPKNTVRVFVFLFPFIVDVFQISARIVLGIFLLIDNLLPFILSGGGRGSGVAYGAHLGGFFAGLGAAFAINRLELGRRPRKASTSKPVPSRAPDVGQQIETAITRGAFGEAAETYFSLPTAATRRLLAPAPLLALGHWLSTHDQAEAALVAFRRFLRDYPTSEGAAEAHLGIGLLRLYHYGQVAAAYQHLLEVLDLEPSRETEARARAALGDIAARQKWRIR